jgi:hypothetical protein
MKNRILLFIFIGLFTAAGFSQWEVRGSMGLNLVTMPDLRDYINANYAPPEDRLDDFSSTIEFAGEVGYELSDIYQLGLETAVEINSYTYNVLGSQYEFAYNVVSPTVMGYYYLKGVGYKFKFGAGIGPRFFLSTEKKLTNQEIDYNSIGFGGVLKIEAATALSTDVFAYIAGDLRYSALGTPENSSGTAYQHQQSDLSITALSGGLKLGIMVLF